MYRAADHTMSNVMGACGLWEEEFARLDAIRLGKGVGNPEWIRMRRGARKAKLSFLAALAAILEGRI